MSYRGTHRRPATAPNSTSPLILPPLCDLKAIPQKAQCHDDTLSGVFSRILNLGTNARKSGEIISPAPDQSDDTVTRTGRRLSLRYSSRRLSSPQTSSQHATTSTARLATPQNSLSIKDTEPKSYTIKPSISPLISIADYTEEDSDEPSANRRKELQLQMARLAKLRRHLGEDIPPEMVLSLVDAAEARGLVESLSSPKEDLQRQQSSDPNPLARQSSKLRKRRSLRNGKSIVESQTHDDHAVEKELPYQSHLPRTEVNLSEPREPRDPAPPSGSDIANHSSVSPPHGVQRHPHPAHITMPFASTSERSQTRENSVMADPTLHDLNGEDRETGLEISDGIEYPDFATIDDIDPRSPPAGGTDVDPSISTQTSSYPELEVSVRISRRPHFWQMKFGKDVTRSARPDDVTKQLRAMKAST